MNQLFVGIDMGSQNNAVYLMKPDGEKHSSFRIQNNRGGAKLLTEKIVSAIQSQGLEGVVIGMEATSIYGDSLVYALREDGKLGQYPRKIHVLNPKQVNKFKESYSDLPKNDDVDAFVIADKLRFGRITKEVYMDDYRYKALQTLTRLNSDVGIMPPLIVRAWSLPARSKSEKSLITVACWHEKVRLIKSLISDRRSLEAMAWNFSASPSEKLSNRLAR